MKKKILSSVFILTFLFYTFQGLYAAPVLYGIVVGGVHVTSANANDIVGDNITGKVSYDASTQTLSLKDAAITGTLISSSGTSFGAGIYSPDNITLYIDGACVISDFEHDGAKFSSGISSGGRITFTGWGELKVFSAPCTDADSYGIYCMSTDDQDGIYVNNCILSTQSGDALNSFGMYSAGGNINLSSCMLTSMSGRGTKNSGGLFLKGSGNINILHSLVDTIGGECDGVSDSTCTSGHIDIQNSYLSAVTLTAATAQGITADKITINNSTLYSEAATYAVKVSNGIIMSVEGKLSGTKDQLKSSGTVVLKQSSTSNPVSIECKHTHDFSGDWKTDNDKHWKQCICGEKESISGHSYAWIIDKPASTAEKGHRYQFCDVCRKYGISEDIPIISIDTVLPPEDTSEDVFIDDITYAHETDIPIDEYYPENDITDSDSDANDFPLQTTPIEDGEEGKDNDTSNNIATPIESNKSTDFSENSEENYDITSEEVLDRDGQASDDPIWLWIILVIVLLAAGAGGFFVYKNKLKK